MIGRWGKLMDVSYRHLGPFSDWVGAARAQRDLDPIAPPGEETRQRVRQVLGFSLGAEAPLDARSEYSWERDGVMGEAISWSVGYGPRTQAWLLKPVGGSGQLAGVVA